MPKASESRIPCSKQTRFALQRAKRRGETYNKLLQKMLDQYDPEAALDRQTGENR